MTGYTEIMDDIAIAQVALKRSLLCSTVSNCQMLCDVYCIPAHNHQVFYLQVYGGNDYTLLYVKTCISDIYGNEIVMYPFKKALKADESAVQKGDIYCGIKHLPRDNPTISQLVLCLPMVEENHLEEGLAIDSVCTVIRNMQVSPPVSICYSNSRHLEMNKLTGEQTDFMDNLYLHIENIIGNLLNNGK